MVNALFKQRACLENIFRACLGLPAQNHMGLQYKTNMNTSAQAEKVSTMKAQLNKTHLDSLSTRDFVWPDHNL